MIPRPFIGSWYDDIYCRERSRVFQPLFAHWMRLGRPCFRVVVHAQRRPQRCIGDPVELQLDATFLTDLADLLAEAATREISSCIVRCVFGTAFL